MYGTRIIYRTYLWIIWSIGWTQSFLKSIYRQYTSWWGIESNLRNTFWEKAQTCFIVGEMRTCTTLGEPNVCKGSWVCHDNIFIALFFGSELVAPLWKAVLSVSGKCVDRVGFSWCGSPGAGCLFTFFPYRKVREKVRPHII